MKALIIFALLYCGGLKSGPILHNGVWRYTNPIKRIDSFEFHQFHNGISAEIPFIWDQKNVISSLDSLIHLVADMKHTKHPKAFVDVNGIQIFYFNRRKIFTVHKCKYVVYKLHVSKGAEWFEDDDYEAFYLEGMGIIRAVATNNVDPSVAWAQYSLTDVQDTKHRSVIDTAELQMLQDKIESFIGN